MNAIQGTIRLGEATPTARTTAKHQRGGMWVFWALITVLVLGFGIAGIWLAWWAKVDGTLGWLGGALAGLVAYHRLSPWLSVVRYRQTLTGKGVPLDIASRFEITDAAFVHESAGVVSIAQWAAVSEIFYEKGWWVFMVQATPWYAPDRFFADDQAKRDFLAAVLTHMTDEARGRSGDAVRFVKKHTA